MKYKTRLYWNIELNLSIGDISLWVKYKTRLYWNLVPETFTFCDCLWVKYKTRLYWNIYDELVAKLNFAFEWSIKLDFTETFLITAFVSPCVLWVKYKTRLYWNTKSVNGE